MGGYGSDDPWFRVGTVGFNTTMTVIALGIVSLIVWAAEGPGRAISKYLWLPSRDLGSFSGGSVLEGQIWRLVTWPISNSEPTIWIIVLFAVFFMLGSQLEATMGRRLFTIYLLLMTVVPAVVVTLYELISGTQGLVAGLRTLELGVLVGFAVWRPSARFFFGIPAWGIAAVIVGLEFLRSVGDRDSHSLVVLLTTVAVALLGIRAMGFAEESEWIPKLPLPAVVGGASRSSGSKRKPATRRKKRSRANLSVAPAPTAPSRQPLSKLEEAEMDSILDQVGERGMDSLTPQQRARLQEHSKRLRHRDN